MSMTFSEVVGSHGQCHPVELESVAFLTPCWAVISWLGRTPFGLPGPSSVCSRVNQVNMTQPGKRGQASLANVFRKGFPWKWDSIKVRNLVILYLRPEELAGIDLSFQIAKQT